MTAWRTLAAVGMSGSRATELHVVLNFLKSWDDGEDTLPKVQGTYSIDWTGSRYIMQLDDVDAGYAPAKDRRPHACRWHWPNHVAGRILPNRSSRPQEFTYRLPMPR